MSLIPNDAVYQYSRRGWDYWAAERRDEDMVFFWHYAANDDTVHGLDYASYHGIMTPDTFELFVALGFPTRHSTALTDERGNATLGALRRADLLALYGLGVWTGPARKPLHKEVLEQCDRLDESVSAIRSFWILSLFFGLVVLAALGIMTYGVAQCLTG